MPTGRSDVDNFKHYLEISRGGDARAFSGGLSYYDMTADKFSRWLGVQPHFKEVTIKLSNDAEWSDREPLSARDVGLNFRRAHRRDFAQQLDTYRAQPSRHLHRVREGNR
jgi:hypothetical protein